MKKILLPLLLLTTLFTALNAGFYDTDVVNTIQIYFEDSNWDYQLDQLYSQGNEDRLLGTLIVNDVVYDSVGVRYKGNSTYSSNRDKNPLNIKLDYVIEDQAIDGKYDKLKLSNGYNDPSLVREVLGYKIARKYMPASKANYAVVYVNDVQLGVYTSVQDVDGEFVSSNLNTSNKARIKGAYDNNQVSTVWGYNGTNSSYYSTYFELDSDDTDWTDLTDFLYSYHNDDNFDSYMDLDQHLWFLAFNNLIVNLDSPINFNHNYYLLQDESDRFNTIIWDLNESFGIFARDLAGGQLSSASLRNLSPYWHSTSNYFPIISRVLEDDTHQKMYIAHMRTMIEENFENDWYITEAQELQSTVGPYVQNDPNLFYTYTNFVNNITTDISSGGGPGGGQSKIGLSSLMDSRVSYLLSSSYFSGTVPTINEITTSPVVPVAGNSLTFRVNVQDAIAVELAYRQDDSSPFTKLALYDDGNHDDGAANDGVFGNSVIIGSGEIQYYAWAESSTQGAFYPATAAHEFLTLHATTETGDVVINEINYNSSDDFAVSDWVELYNPGDTSLDLSGWMLKDDNDEHVFEIPAGNTIESHDYLVLCADSAAFTTLFPDVTNYIGDIGFGFGSGGDAVRLFDSSNTIIDSLTYDDSAPWPEAADGTGATLALIDPAYDNELPENWSASTGSGTPGARNFDAPMIVINEINYNSSDTFDTEDWIELYNPTDSSIDISGWEFRDEDDTHIYLIPDGTVIDADGYLVLCADTALFSSLFPSVANFIGNFEFGLGSGGDTVRILMADGTVVDQVIYDDEGLWPTEPDGFGATLELTDALANNAEATNWVASADNGTPGRENSITEVEDEEIPQVTNLETSVYPNPFNPSTTISFSIPKSTNVNISVFNARGQKVTTLTNETYHSGTHNVNWNGKDRNNHSVASGLYFYRVTTDNSSKTNKMILMK